MTSRNRILSATVLLAITSGLVYWIVKPKSSPPGAGQTQDASAAPANPAHELAALEESLRQSPNHVPILLRLAEMKHQAGKTAEAITHLQAAVKAEPANVDARLELGRLLFEEKDVDGALQVTDAILKSDPTTSTRSTTSAPFTETWAKRRWPENTGAAQSPPRRTLRAVEKQRRVWSSCGGLRPLR